MADRNFSSNLVLSVFPAPLSPLLIDSPRGANQGIQNGKNDSEVSTHLSVPEVGQSGKLVASLLLSPDQNALAVMTPPEAAVALTGCGKNVRRQLPQAMLSIQVNGGCIVQPSNGFVGIHRNQDRTDACLQRKGRKAKHFRFFMFS